MELIKLIAIFALGVAFAPQADAAARTTTPKPCYKIDLSIAKKCCNFTIKPVASDAVLKVCNPKNDKKLNMWVNEYQLYKLQTGPNNTVDITNKANIKTMCTVAPFINCLFVKHNITDNKATPGTYKGAAAFEVTVKNYPDGDFMKDEAGTLIVEDYYANEHIPQMYNTTIECGKDKTPVYIGWMFIVQYLQNYIPQACRHAIYTTKNKCNATIINFDKCNEDLHNQIYNSDSRFKSEFSTFVKAPMGKRKAFKHSYKK